MFQKKVVQEIKTHILCSVIFFIFFENPAVYEIMWRDIVERGRTQKTVYYCAGALHFRKLRQQTRSQNT